MGCRGYDRVSDVQEDWSRAVLDRLDLRGDETVLDAGCGSGRVTRLLLERLPEGRVIGVDSSRSMIEEAREALPDRTEFIVSDLLDLDLDEAVDAVFSNATFHWILDHRRLFERLYAALRPGGRVGGAVRRDRQPGRVPELARERRRGRALRAVPPRHRQYAGTSPRPATPMCASRALGSSGCGAGSSSESRSHASRANFCETVCCGGHLDRLPENLHEPYLDAVLEYAPRPLTLDYMRLNISARRPALVPAAVRVAERAAQLLGDPAGMAERLVA